MHALLLLCINQHTKFEVRSFTNSKNMIKAKFKKTGHVTLTAPVNVYFVIPRLAFNIFYLHTKFGDSRLSRRRYDCSHRNI